MNGRARIGRIALVVLGVVVLVWLIAYPASHDKPQTALYGQVFYFAIAAMGLNLLTGYNGQVSIGHGAFFGIGAFTSAILITDHGWPFLATLPLAALLSLVVGVLAGFPALRVKGLYLALVTLGLAVLFPDLVRKFVETGGKNLVSVRPKQMLAPSWWPGDHTVAGQYKWAYTFSLIMLVALFAVAVLIVRSRFGKALIAVRDQEAAAATVGINPAFVKLSAFGISAMYAGIAGSLSVLVIGTANADRATTFTISILFLVAVVIGGTATVVGPLIGGFIVVMVQDWIGKFVGEPSILFHPAFLEDFFRGKQVLSPAIFGIALILLMYVLPDGIVGGVSRLYRRVAAPPLPAEQPNVSTPVAN